MDPSKIGFFNEDGSEHKIYKICLTGGPCAGKTSSMNYLKEKLSATHIVYVLPEVAATTVGAGVTIIPSEFTPATHKVFTVTLFSHSESHFLERHHVDVDEPRGLLLHHRNYLEEECYHPH